MTIHDLLIAGIEPGDTPLQGEGTGFVAIGLCVPVVLCAILLAFVWLCIGEDKPPK